MKKLDSEDNPNNEISEEEMTCSTDEDEIAFAVLIII